MAIKLMLVLRERADGAELAEVSRPFQEMPLVGRMVGANASLLHIRDNWDNWPVPKN